MSTKSATRAKQEKWTKFCRAFWTQYTELYPNDGVRADFGGPSPDYRVEGTCIKVRRLLSYRYVGVCLSRDDSMQSLEELTEPYIENLAEKLGCSPEHLRNFHGKAQNCNSLSRLCIVTRDRENWPQAAYTLHKYLEIYLDALV